MAKTAQKDIDRSTKWKREHPEKIKEWALRDREKSRKKSLEYYHLHKEEILAKNKANGCRKQKNFNCKKRMGITYDEYLIYTFAKKNEQLGACAICGSKDKKLGLDHNHETNQLRGMLCVSCNNSLGLMKENKFFLHRMIEYIDKYQKPQGE